MATEDNLMKTVLVIVAALLFIPLLMMAVLLPMMGLWGWGHMWNGAMWGGTGATWMWLGMWLLVLGIVVVFGYVLYSAVRRPAGEETDAALEELRVTYARGELSDEEYENRRERLQREK